MVAVMFVQNKQVNPVVDLGGSTENVISTCIAQKNLVEEDVVSKILLLTTDFRRNL